MLSYETYANVRDMIDAESSESISMKGISRPIVPYLVRGVRGELGGDTVITEMDEGLSLTLDTAGLDLAKVARLRNRLQSALAQLEAKLAVPSPSKLYFIGTKNCRLDERHFDEEHPVGNHLGGNDYSCDRSRRRNRDCPIR